jgi:ribosome-associated toxin RatA of RatAB toxin-antitoxin module
MNKKAVFGAIGVVVIVALGFVGYKVMSLRAQAAKWAGPMKEIVEETVTHDNNVTRARYVSLIDAPLAKVQQAVWNVENSQETVANIKLSKLLEQKDNTKLVEINLQALNLPLQTYTMEFTLHPEEHRVTFKTVKSQAQDIEGEYKFEASPDGTRTRLVYTSTAKDKIAVPFPQSVLDSANRETYVNTVRGIEKSIKQG